MEAMLEKENIISVRSLDLYYGTFQALKNINLYVKKNQVTAFIGPSGCGKSTLLRTFNRMNDLIEGVKINGKVFVSGEMILKSDIDLVALRKKVGMVFQRPNPFALSVFENVAYGLRIRGEKRKAVLKEAVARSLETVLLFDSLKDNLDKNALGLTLEQQQRLCIARALAVNPEIILLDEPCSALDPVSTEKIEELLQELKKNYTIVIVTHNMQQAARVADLTAFFLLGDLVEFDETSKIFTAPKDKRTEDYITGRFG